MRILILFHSEHPAVSGADHMAWQTAKALAAAGHEVTVAFRSAMLQACSRERSGDLWQIVLPDQRETSVRMVLDHSYDILHLIDFVAGSFLLLALELQTALQIPLVVTPATDSELWQDLEAAERVLQRAALVLALTEAEREQLIRFAKLPPEKMRLVPHAPYLEVTSAAEGRAGYGIPDDAFVVLFLARKLVSKGYRVLLDAAERVWADHPKTWFVFAGPPGDGSADVFTEWSDEPRILDLGLVTEAVKRFVLETCDLLCLPSTADVFPLVFLEAWAHGKPVIGSKLFAAGGVIRHLQDGLLVEPASEAVGEAICLLLQNRPLAERLGENGRLRVQSDHSWQAVGTKTQEAYAHAMSKGKEEGSR